MSVSMTGLSFFGTVGLFAALVAVAAFHFRARRPARWLLVALSLVTSLLLVAGAANAYFDYYPTVASILGQTARDHASHGQLLRRLAGGRRERRAAGIHAAPVAVRLVARDQRDADDRPKPPRGLVESVSIPSTVSGFHARPAEVYLPPAWFASPRPSLPVIELLHGTPGAPDDWTRAGSADLIADRFAAAHAGLAPIIVMPDINGGFLNDSECVDSGARRVETYLTVDVPTYVVNQLGAASGASSWAIAGGSEGGFCALDLALRHPDRWATFADFAGLDRPTYPGGALRHLFAGSTAALAAHQPLQLLAGRPVPAVAGWFEAGAADGATTQSLLRAARAAKTAGLDTHVVVVPGAHHTWRFFRHSLRDSFDWLAGRLGISGTTPST